MANTWQEMRMNHAVRGSALVVAGVILTVFLMWFFGGFGFWGFPGLAILLVGVGDVLFTLYRTMARKGSRLIHSGFLTLFFGIAMYLSLAGHVMLGFLQMVSLAVVTIGLLLALAGAVTRSNA
jgi:hypothetical protein